MDLSGFKKVAETDQQATLEHPDGHQIHIAKSGLSKKLLEKLSDIPIYKSGGGDERSAGADGPPPPVVNVNVGQPQGMDSSQRSLAPNPQPQYGKFGQVIPPPQAPAPAPMQTAPVSTTGSQNPQVQPIAQPQDAFSQYAKDERAAIGSGIQGEQQKATALGNIGTQEAAEHQRAIEQQQQMMSKWEDTNNNLQQEREGFINDIKNNQVDPQHYWANHSKVATAIGMILGGLGGSDAPIKFLENQMDQDLKSQQDNIGARKTLLEANLRQFGNMRDAMTMTRIMQNDMLANKIQEIAAKNQSPLAQAQAKIAISPLLEKSAQLQQSLAINKMLAQQSPQNQGQQNQPQRLELMRRTGVINDKQYEKGNEELGNYQKTQAAHEALDRILPLLSQQQGTLNRLANPIQSKQRIAALRAELVPLIMEANPSKRLTHESLSAEIDPLIEKWSTNKGTAEEMAKGLHRLVDTHAGGTPTLEGIGMAPRQYEPKIGEIKTMNGVQYRKVKGGYQKI